ncbi:hypothetical protein HDU82_003438 [Entophlyctis luteolus]|nr:hypothetical protein HDU82_003438 [Entophlyctis luteolus]
MQSNTSELTPFVSTDPDSQSLSQNHHVLHPRTREIMDRVSFNSQSDPLSAIQELKAFKISVFDEMKSLKNHVAILQKQNQAMTTEHSKIVAFHQREIARLRDANGNLEIVKVLERENRRLADDLKAFVLQNEEQKERIKDLEINLSLQKAKLRHANESNELKQKIIQEFEKRATENTTEYDSKQLSALREFQAHRLQDLYQKSRRHLEVERKHNDSLRKTLTESQNACVIEALKSDVATLKEENLKLKKENLAMKNIQFQHEKSIMSLTEANQRQTIEDLDQEIHLLKMQINKMEAKERELRLCSTYIPALKQYATTGLLQDQPRSRGASAAVSRSHKLKMNEEEVPLAQSLASALTHARVAAELDATGEHIRALAAYRRCLLLIDATIGSSDMDTIQNKSRGARSLDDSTRTSVIDLRSRYVCRVDEILAGLPTSATASSLAVYSGAGFVHPAEIDTEAPVPPAKATLNRNDPNTDTLYSGIFERTIFSFDDTPSLERQAPMPSLWAPKVPPSVTWSTTAPSALQALAARMRIICATITDGAFVSPRLAIPRQVWNQPPGVRLVALDQKLAALDTILQVVRDRQSSSLPFHGEVASVKNAVESVLNNNSLQLLKKLNGEIPTPFADSNANNAKPSTDMMKMMKNALTAAATGGAVAVTVPKGDKVGHLGSYSDLISRLFKALDAMFESWASQVSTNSDSNISASVEFVVRFFDNVVLAFVTRDIERLTENYIRMISAAATNS